MYKWLKSLVVIWVLLIAHMFPQEHSKHGHRKIDPRHSIYGPVRPTVWEFQIGFWSYDNEIASAFDFYSKNQRNKTFFMRYTNNGLDNRSLFKVKQLTGGVVLFPYKDDDRFRVDFGGTYDIITDTLLTNKTVFSRVTFRPYKLLWFRIGFESMTGYKNEHLTRFKKTKENAAYFVGKFENTRFSLIALAGTGENNNDPRNKYGSAGVIKGPFNTYLLGGYIKSDNTLENVRTLSIGRWASFRPDGIPSGFVIWKHKDNYDFQLGGLLWGKTNLFVRPAALGMTQGILISSMALRDNSLLRQGQLMTITDEYRYADNSLFYVYLNQSIEIIPGSMNNVSIKAIRFYKMFSKIKFSAISNPMAGIFYDEETKPDYNPITYSFKDKTTAFFAFQVGATIFNQFILNAISYPNKSEWNIAISYIYR